MSKEPPLRDYQQAKDWLFSLKNRGAHYGIDRMRGFAEAIGNPEKGYPVIHIAGTNGKGSTAAMLESIYRLNGYRTGLFTSPHLIRQGERIQVDREILAERDILRYTQLLKPIAESIAEREQDMHPSFFEFMTAMAFLRFKERQVDIAIVEVGLGGRLDASNIVDPVLSVITSLGLDHCEILGNTIEAIAREKAGIVKPGKPVVIGWLPEAGEQVVAEICAERGSPLVAVRKRFGSDLDRYPKPRLGGEVQRINAAVALTVSETLQEPLPIDGTTALQALQEVQWRGRWERLLWGQRQLILDATHNEEGAAWLDRNLEALVLELGRPDMVLGVLGVARARSLIETASRWARSITFVIPKQARACSFEELEGLVPASFGGTVERGRLESIFCSGNAPDIPGPPLVVTGSIYLIGEVLDTISEGPSALQAELQDF